MTTILDEQINQLKQAISELRKAIGEFVNYYNNQRYHESLENMTPVDVFFWIIKGNQKQTREDQAKNDGLTTTAELDGC